MDSSNLVGNLALCGTKSVGQPCSIKRKSQHKFQKKTIWILSALGAVFLLLVLSVLLAVFIRKQNKTEAIVSEEGSAFVVPPGKLERFDGKELEKATDFFSEENKIGASSLSTVYKGRLEDGRVIAVKKLNLEKFSAAESDKWFYREAKTLSQLRHRCLVKVVGYAWESGKIKALVLEYMKNGNLDSVIHDSSQVSVDQSRWTIPERINVCISIASGLEYLHTGYGSPIVHCDLKPSNILLDEDWVAHVSDFGTARILGVHLQDVSSAFEGTIGYMAPEFAYMRRVTTKVDVFSFGIVMMELFTKRRPTGLVDEQGFPISLSQLVQKAVCVEMDGDWILDGEMISGEASCKVVEQEKVEKVLRIALSCARPNPEDRPGINAVLAALEKLRD
ncbi:LRR receptor-like serine/threonine-protein kinase FLS2 [Linum grandiflorum]